MVHSMVHVLSCLQACIPSLWPSFVLAAMVQFDCIRFQPIFHTTIQSVTTARVREIANMVWNTLSFALHRFLLNLDTRSLFLLCPPMLSSSPPCAQLSLPGTVTFITFHLLSMDYRSPLDLFYQPNNLPVFGNSAARCADTVPFFGILFNRKIDPLQLDKQWPFPAAGKVSSFFYFLHREHKPIWIMVLTFSFCLHFSVRAWCAGRFVTERRREGGYDMSSWHGCSVCLFFSY